VNVIVGEGRMALGRLTEHVTGLEELAVLCEPFTPDAVAPHTGITAEEIRRMAHDLTDADKAAVYGRIGTTTQTFGTLASWLVDVLNVITGNLDREGGAMFPLAAAGQSNSTSGPRRSFAHGRWHSRVRNLPEVMGELPVATLAEEILAPGAGQVRALITLGGNPCLSTPNAERLTEAVQQLDFMVSIDVYLNETSRHADVILPGPEPLARDHYDLVFYQLAVRNVANWTPAVLGTDIAQEWQSLLRLVGIVTGQGPQGVDVAVASPRTGPARLVDLMLHAGPYDITLADLEAAPHGIDLGPLQPRIPEVLNTPSGKIEIAPEAITVDVARLAAVLARSPEGQLVLIGRRQLNSNNSWMHNLAPLVRGRNRCTAHVHPDTAARLGLVDGANARVRSRTGAITVPVEITDSIRPGVVSIPHGWGHDVDGARTSVAAAHAGANSNVLADDLLVDGLTGTAVLNGIPIEVTPTAAR